MQYKLIFTYHIDRDIDVGGVIDFSVQNRITQLRVYYIFLRKIFDISTY